MYFIVNSFDLSIICIFLTTSFFTTLLSLLKSIKIHSNFPISNLSNLLFKLLKLVGKFFSLSTSNLSTLAFKLGKSDFAANLEVSIRVTFFKSDFVA